MGSPLFRKGEKKQIASHLVYSMKQRSSVKFLPLSISRSGSVQQVCVLHSEFTLRLFAVGEYSNWLSGKNGAGEQCQSFGGNNTCSSQETLAGAWKDKQHVRAGTQQTVQLRATGTQTRLMLSAASGPMSIPNI